MTKNDDCAFVSRKEELLNVDNNTNKWNLYILKREVNNVIRSENKELKSKIRVDCNRYIHSNAIENFEWNSYVLSSVRREKELKSELL